MTRNPVMGRNGCEHAWTEPLYTRGDVHIADVCLHCTKVTPLNAVVERECSWCKRPFEQYKVAPSRMHKTCSVACRHHLPLRFWFVAFKGGGYAGAHWIHIGDVVHEQPSYAVIHAKDEKDAERVVARSRWRDARVVKEVDRDWRWDEQELRALRGEKA